VLEAAYEETEDPVIERQFTIANTTVARLRLAVRDYEGALGSFQSALGLLPEEGEDRVLQSQCLFGSGLANFKLGALDMAIQNFEEALVAAGDDLQMRGHVTVLLSQTLWATGTQEGQEAAKSQLLDWCAFSVVSLTHSLTHSRRPGPRRKYHTGPGELDGDQRARRHGNPHRR
jgi:superkiller protein 3